MLFTTITGLDACVTTPNATLPSNFFEKLVLPLFLKYMALK